MMNPIKPLAWLVSTDPRNRAKFHAWRYNVFGDGDNTALGGRGVTAYEVIDNLDGRFVNRDWPKFTAGLGAVIAEMSNHAYVAFMVPHVIPEDEVEAEAMVKEEETEAMKKVADYFEPEIGTYNARVYKEALPDLYNKWRRIEEEWRKIRFEEK